LEAGCFGDRGAGEQAAGIGVGLGRGGNCNGKQGNDEDDVGKTEHLISPAWAHAAMKQGATGKRHRELDGPCPQPDVLEHFS
jgi:hypothetical protein